MARTEKIEAVVIVGGEAVAVGIDRSPPLGWRFWTFAGFPGDPLEPRPYGGSRGIPLCLVEGGRGERWLTAMELDGTAQLFTSHELFPCPDQDGAEEFGRAWIEQRSRQPSLL